MTTQFKTESDFLQAFQIRHEYSRLLLELSKEQQKCIDESDTTKLLEVLSQKQRVVDEYVNMRNQQPNLAKDWKAVRNSFDQQSRQKCDHFLEQAEAMFLQLMTSEKECTQQLTEQKNKTEQQLRTVTAGVAAHHSYHDEQVVNAPKHLDINH